MNERILRIADVPVWRDRAVAWFHEKWHIPADAYRASMDEAIRGTAPVPQWYLAVAGDAIVGGMGVISNDFHDRIDLTPNVCAVYTEEAYRGQGIAGRLLHFVAKDMRAQGINTLYLVTDHTAFYERYGWEFFCMARGEDGADTRLYRYCSKTDKERAIV